MPQAILVVEEDDAQREILRQVIQSRFGYHVIGVDGGRAALERFMLKLSPHPDLLIVNLHMPDMNGVELIRKIRRTDTTIPIIAMAPSSSGATIQAAIDSGASDIVLKPATAEQLQLSMQNLLRVSVLQEEVARLSRYHKMQVLFEDVVGSSDVVKQMKQQARRAVDSGRPLYLHGARSTGKEMLARAIHGSGARSGKPFVVLNAAIMHDDPDPVDTLTDFWALAGEGTLAIKHVESLTPTVQDALLALMSKAEPGPRLITMSDVSERVLLQQDDIREALFFRLTVFSIEVPSIEARGDDVLLLAEHYLMHELASQNRHITGFDADAAKLLMSYAWPGNVDELRKIIQYITYICEEPKVRSCHVVSAFAEHNRDAFEAMDASEELMLLVKSANQQSNRMNLLSGDGNVRTIDELEADMIRYAIRRYNGKMTEVARRLGIGRSTLYRKIQDYNLGEGEAA